MRTGAHWGARLRGPVGAGAGLALLGVLTLLAICASWLAEDSASVGYWLSSQLVLVLYGLLAWWASRPAQHGAGPAAGVASREPAAAVPPHE